MLLQILVVYFILLLSNFYFWISNSLFIFQVMNIQVISSLGQLLIKLLGTFANKILCGYMSLFLLVKSLSVTLLGHMVSIFNFVRNYETVSQRGCAILHSCSDM